MSASLRCSAWLCAEPVPDLGRKRKPEARIRNPHIRSHCTVFPEMCLCRNLWLGRQGTNLGITPAYFNIPYFDHSSLSSFGTLECRKRVIQSTNDMRV
jgi:hypothetical protein